MSATHIHIQPLEGQPDHLLTPECWCHPEVLQTTSAVNDFVYQHSGDVRPSVRCSLDHGFDLFPGDGIHGLVKGSHIKHTRNGIAGGS